MSKISAGSRTQFQELPNCLKSKCTGPNSATIDVEGITIVCNKSGEIKNYKQGSSVYIKCPDLSKFCSLDHSRCKNECNHQGRCLKNAKCWCFVGFTGDDCGTREMGTYRFNTLGGLESGNNVYQLIGFAWIMVLMIFLGFNN